jgi:hypothetical protein
VAVNFTGYTPPGVYVQAEAEGVFVPQSLPTQNVTIVGAARGWQTTTEVVTLLATASPLSKKGVLADADASPDLKVNLADGTVLAENTDYTLDRGATSNDFTTIAWKSGSTKVPAAGVQVYVAYSYADDDYYMPKVFDDYLSVERTFGAAMISVTPEDPNATHVSSPLSLAARIAFQNGAGTVRCLALDATGSAPVLTQFTNAYDKLLNDYATTLLVPIYQAGPSQTAADYTSGFNTFVADLKAHCESQAGDGYGRIGLAGADTIYNDGSGGTPFEEIAANIESARVVLAYPYRMSFHNFSLGQATEVGGCYLAAAYAGMLASNTINRGITQQVVTGFTGIASDLRTLMTNLFKNSLSGNGVAVTEYGRNNRLQCRHGVTTKVGDLTTAEISVVRAGDALFQLVSEGVTAADLIGDPIDDEMTIKVKGIVTGILESAIADEVILDYLNVQVRQQQLPSGDPTAIECLFVYRPFLPLNYITVVFSMDLSTGEVTVEEAEVAA